MTGTNQGIAAGLVVLLASCGGWGDVSSSELDLSIDAAFVTQGTQDAIGSVPLVQGREGWVRVIVTANQPNNAWPDVRVTLFEGGAPVTTLTVPAPSLVPFETDQGSMAQTWNVRLPGAEVQPGRSILVELDPAGEYGDRNPANDAWPAPGTPQPLDVRVAPPLEVMFVPLAVNGYYDVPVWSTISEADLAEVEETLRAFLPVVGITTSVHEVVFTDIDFWTELSPVYAAYLRVEQLRAAEQGAGSRVHYVAVLPWREANYVDAGGLGSLDGYNVALWDYGFDRREPLVPHELGHNFGLGHTPCTPPGVPIEGVDPGWPTDPAHAGAHLGTWGMDVASGEPKDPRRYHDLMSYCSPVWISDYSYELALSLRAAQTAATVATAAVGPGVLLSGSVDALRGAVLGEPVLVSAAGAGPGAGPDAIEARDAAGALLFAIPFEPNPVADADPELRTFAFTVPLAPERAAAIAELRWLRGGVELVRRTVARVEAPVRDPVSGAIVAFPATWEVTP